MTTVVAGGPGWRGELVGAAVGVAHAYLSCACLHGQHEQCGLLQRERGDEGAPHCKFCPAVCLCPTCRHVGAFPAVASARGYHSAYGTPQRRAAQVRRLHIVNDAGMNPGRQTFCGQIASSTFKGAAVILDPLPSTPPAGLTWCPTCVGRLAEQSGFLAAFAAVLSAAA